jgi:hypothetical protein
VVVVGTLQGLSLVSAPCHRINEMVLCQGLSQSIVGFARILFTSSTASIVCTYIHSSLATYIQSNGKPTKSVGSTNQPTHPHRFTSFPISCIYMRPPTQKLCSLLCVCAVLTFTPTIHYYLIHCERTFLYLLSFLLLVDGIIVKADFLLLILSDLCFSHTDCTYIELHVMMILLLLLVPTAYREYAVGRNAKWSKWHSNAIETYDMNPLSLLPETTNLDS